MCFSLYTNGYKILSTKQPPGALTCLNGIRFISMLWVILGHTLVFSTSSISEYYVALLLRDRALHNSETTTSSKVWYNCIVLYCIKCDIYGSYFIFLLKHR